MTPGSPASLEVNWLFHWEAEICQLGTEVSAYEVPAPPPPGGSTVSFQRPVLVPNPSTGQVLALRGVLSPAGHMPWTGLASAVACQAVSITAEDGDWCCQEKLPSRRSPSWLPQPGRRPRGERT